MNLIKILQQEETQESVGLVKDFTQPDEDKKVQKTDTTQIFDAEEDLGELSVSAYISETLNFDGSEMEEEEQIELYRKLSNNPVVRFAVSEITNEAIVTDTKDNIVNINLDDLLKTKDTIKKKIEEEFIFILNLLNFSNLGDLIFEDWYIDGRVCYGVGVNSKNPKKGIHSLVKIDPLNLKKIYHIKEKKYYWFYSPKRGRLRKTGKRVRSLPTQNHLIDPNKEWIISNDLIVVAPSGLIDKTTGKTISYIHPAIKAINQLRLLEDSLVIYRITRAPERRVFTIYTGQMPKTRADQHVKKIQTKYRNRQVYDIDSGQIKDQNAIMAMQEDIFIPQTASGKGSSVTTLEGGHNLGELDDIFYFMVNVYRALHIPKSRIEMMAEPSPFNAGRIGEITRDEVKFFQFVERLRRRFDVLFTEILGRQILFKNILNKQEWDDIRNLINYDYNSDNHYQDFKKFEVLQSRMGVATEADSFRGVYLTREWIAINIFGFTEQEWEKMKEAMEKEKKEDEDVPPPGENDAMTAGGEEEPPPEEEPPAEEPPAEEPPPEKKEEPPQPKKE